MEAWRNVNADVVEAKSEQLYANHYHNDGYLMTYFKLHINSSDVMLDFFKENLGYVYFKYHPFDEKKYKRNYGRSNYLVKIKK